MGGVQRLELAKHNVLGLHLHEISIEQVQTAIIEKAMHGQSGYVCVTNVHQCVLVHDDTKFAEKVNAATFVVADSVILQRAKSIWHNLPYVGTKIGAQIMLDLCEMAANEGIKVALVGGKNEGVLCELKRRLIAQFPTLNIAYAVSPPFRQISEEEDEAITTAISKSGAGLIFVGLGCPKQENWMADHTERINAMMIGVGAAFDVNAGVVKPSPKWVHGAGLEWLYRLAREPRRLWKRYLTTSPRFVWLLILDAIQNRSKPV